MLSFEAIEKDGSPRKFVGMHRPTYESLVSSSVDWTVMELPNGQMVYRNQVRGHWLEGVFDRPLYEVTDA